MNINAIMKGISQLSKEQISEIQKFINNLSYREANIDTFNTIFNSGHIIGIEASSNAKNKVFLTSLVSATDYFDDATYFTRFLFKDLYEREYGIDIPCDVKLEFFPEQPSYAFDEPLHFFYKTGDNRMHSFECGVKRLVICQRAIQYGVYDISTNEYMVICKKTEDLLKSCKKSKPTSLIADDKPSPTPEHKPLFGAASPQDDIAIIASNIAVWLDAVDEGQPKRRVILDIKKTFNVNTDIKKVSGRNIFSISFTKIDIDRQHQDLIFHDGENSTKIDYSEFGTISWCDDYAVFKMSNTDGSHIIKMRFMDSDGKMMKYTEIINKGE